MSFALYLIGALFIIAGVAWALIVAGVAALYISITCLILLGVGILTGVVTTRPKDPPTKPSQ
jgi:membrane-bound acyltransferase YfiQ involved in biofilm formation